MSSCTLASRGSAAGSELAVMDVEDTPRQYIKALALGVRGKVVRGGFAFCGFHCASVVCKTSKACVVTSQQRCILDPTTQSTCQAVLLPVITHLEEYEVLVHLLSSLLCHEIHTHRRNISIGSNFRAGATG